MTLSDDPKPDMVISLRYSNDHLSELKSQLEKLVLAIQSAGLLVQCRQGTRTSLLLFIKCPEARITQESQKSRLQDWLHGVRIANPDENLYRSIKSDPLTQAERLRLVYNLLTSPDGVGLTPKFGAWTMVESIFPLHDSEFDREWLHRISGKWAIDDHELDTIRAQFGEKIAYYFAFLQFYFLWLIIPSLVGIFSYIFLASYSIVFSISIGIWSMVFIEVWRRREIDLAVRWGVNGCSALNHQRAAFVAKKIHGIQDPTDQYLFFKQVLRRLAAVPVALIAGLVLTVILSVIFSIEVFLNEQFLLGKQKLYLRILTYLPTVLFAAIVPIFSKLYTSISQRLTIAEDHETDASFETAWTHKVFLLNFLTAYMSLFLTAYIYVPFGQQVVPKLDFLGLSDARATRFEINPNRLRHQLIYYLVTAQALNAVQQLVVPYLMGRATTHAKNLQTKITKKSQSNQDRKSEASFLERARNEANLPDYKIYTDFSEMVIQVCLLMIDSDYSVWIYRLIRHHLAYHTIMCIGQQSI
ncbi:hypothetical protein NEOLI_000611 [Neolecta irregularis DAH-3]|uniref:Uncharacterized protein n=1 Tax=Neolecta irregularis (strain DAH-3) TaxID=1198029 RepID=A0A1U7LTV1_NEOID|nr:hypothetical protein NEOLI_000611 [Neolecta irregularis DAH-3]|eukprot:OLL26105.1 hypothetical protein NEOLI_000611 [Neolecta irregularis DAH-3]